MDANAHFHLRQALGTVLSVHPLYGQLHRHGAGHRPFGIVLPLDRGAEEDENRVADEFINCALIRLDDLDHGAEIVIEHAHDLFRR